MTAHDQNEATSSISITSLTMVSDCRNNSKIDRVGDTVPGSPVVSRGGIDGGLLWRLLDDRRAGWDLRERPERGAQLRRHPARPAVAPDTGDHDVERDQHPPVAADLLVEREGR